MLAKSSSTLLQSDILKSIEAGVLLWQTNSSTIELYGRWDRLLGYELTTPAAISTQDWLDLLHPEDTQLCISARKEITSGFRDHYSYEARIKHKSGHWLWFKEEANLLQHEDEEPRTVISTLTAISEQKNLEQHCLEAQTQLNNLVKTLPSLVYSISFSSGRMYIFDDDENLMGLAGAEGDASEWWHSKVHPDDVAKQSALFEDWINHGSSDTLYRKYRLLDAFGEYRWIVDRTRAVTSSDRATDFIGSFYPLSELNLLQMRLKKLAEIVPGVIFEYELRADGSSCFPYTSQGIKRIYGVDPEDIRDNADMVYQHIHPDDLSAVKESIQQSAESMREWRVEYRICLPDKTIWVSGYSVPRRTSSGSIIWAGMVVDITEQRAYQDKLKKLASTDELTGIYNRRFFILRMEEFFASVQREQQVVCVAMFDLDFFKKVNDTYGHAMGDEVLKRIAEEVQKNIRRTDIFARIGGEEFALIMPHTSPEEAAVLAEKLRIVIGQLNFTHNGENFKVTATFGIAAMQKGVPRADMVLNQADQAVYKGKNAGRNRVTLCSSLE
ncbi:hypothetical protein CWE09_01530 [Aliidiomarina minuta]|uniref:diguanylate cyclase n=1 Tax=Aliidiomarina minuta TaxID=880057 RepID=A0A432W5U8_9GAMM|nr:sensor domain-containing diguanylate cyclase [Aliidiomarina minuta]RUO25445.1 hypothetical protein CWE09_01530 [Aliidiomarina minuta]